MNPQDIKTLIENHLAETTAEVSSNDNVHFEATVISPAFAGQRTLQRHRQVYAALGTHMGGDIHALTLQVYTPEEWAARGA